jgi:hypothetical protein
MSRSESSTWTNHYHIVGEGLVPSRVSGNDLGVITAGGRKTLRYRNVRILRAFT